MSKSCVPCDKPTVVAGAAVAAVAGVGAYLWYQSTKSGKKKKKAGDVGTAEWVNPYESEKQVNEYLMMHFGTPEELMPYHFGPVSALEFPKRCAEKCMEYVNIVGQMDQKNMRVLDVGCAVGRSSFELCRFFPEIVAFDFSHAFIDTANLLKQKGALPYTMATEGDLTVPCNAVVDPVLQRDRVLFRYGDACNIPVEWGEFDVVMAANLVCRLPYPRKFLSSLARVVKKGGLVLLPSPYTWLEQYTDKEEWMGGYVDKKTGKEVKSIDGFKAILAPHFDLIATEDMPFVIRETARKNQWTVSHLSVWQRRW